MREVIQMKTDEIVRISSREVAEMMETRHSDLLSKIDKIGRILTNEKIRSLNYWVESNYKDKKGELRKEYLISKQGCEMLAHKSTGDKGIIFTHKYMERFKQLEEENKMLKEAVNEKAQLLLQIYNGGQDGIVASKRLTEIEVEEATAPLIGTIKKQKPKVETYDRFVDKEHTLGFRELRKEIESTLGIQIKENILKEVMRENKFIGKTVKATAFAIRNGYAVTKDIETDYGTRTQDRFTMKCRDELLELFSA